MDAARVAVVGDDPVMAELIVLNLLRRGYLAWYMSDVLRGGDWLDLDLLSKAHAIIVDATDCDKRVWHLADALRRAAEPLTVPLVLVLAGRPDERHLLSLAPCAWLQQPYSMAQLLAQLQRSLVDANLA